jgi:DNA mismatch endonuclease (patch repair protein)
MVDHLTKAERSRNMARIRAVDTTPELKVKQTLRKLKIRYSSYPKNLPGKPDILLSGTKKILFVHGCFWHHHKKCKRANLPKTNPSYWLPKIARNVERDQEIRRILRGLGWKTYIIWECETKPHDRLERKINSLIKK